MPQRRVFPFVRILCQRITVYKFINPGMLGACPTRNVLLNFAKLLWMDGTRIHSILPSFGWLAIRMRLGIVLILGSILQWIAPKMN